MGSGLAAVKNVGTGAIEAILAARAEGGAFKSVEDFAKRVDASEVNKKAWESLIKSGGMDCFGESAPAPELFKHFGFTVENVVKTVKSVL
jgi:DNA polymerase-3 subunit alpha